MSAILNIMSSDVPLHGDVVVTPFSIAPDTKVELPGTTISGQLYRRKALMVQHTGGDAVYIGGSNVGFGASFGGGDATTCSGIVVYSGSVWTSNVGRSRVFAYNSSASNYAYLKVMELS